MPFKERNPLGLHLHSDPPCPFPCIFTSDDDTSTEKGPLTPNEADVLDRYPTYFRTAEEQRVVESTVST